MLILKSNLSVSKWLNRTKIETLKKFSEFLLYERVEKKISIKFCSYAFCQNTFYSVWINWIHEKVKNFEK